MPIGIYPPTLQSTQTAFLASTNDYVIYFTLQNVTSISDIGHAQVRIVRQSNNRTIVNTSTYPDGVIYFSAPFKQSGSQYYVTVSRDMLSEVWQAGYLYKIQMRFGSTNLWTDTGEKFAKWKQTQINNQTFSEWSNVMIIKAINEPTVVIENADEIRQDVHSTEHTEATLTPLFSGSYSTDSASNELLDKYRFSLYLGQDIDETNLVETSGWLQHNGDVNTSDTYRFKNILVDNNYYVVTYEIITVNGYEASATAYTFQAVQTFLEELEGMTLTVDDESVYCKENGCIQLYLTTTSNISGCYVITRSSELSDYGVWEDLAYYVYSNQSFSNTLIYQDFTIESGIKYKYAIQMQNAAELRSAPLYEANNNYKVVNFEYAYLYRDGVQLRLKYNNTMTSFKHTTLSAKLDTLGSTYPHLVRNGYAYYAEFPINGLISFQMDEDQTFFVHGDDGYYYDGELVIPNDKFSRYIGNRTNDSLSYLIDSNLTDDNIFVERKFREKVEEFLNNFEYKLFKSPTEGNFIVGLMNISMTPNQQLGRMIYSFTGTAYEVMENTLENLNDVGIINIGSYDTVSSEDITVSFGQIRGLYSEVEEVRDDDGNLIRYSVVSDPTNIIDLIEDQEEISIGGGFRLQLENLRSIWIEPYPLLDLTAELTELEAELAELKEAGEDTTEKEAEIKTYESLQEALQRPSATTTILSVNGNQILITPNKVYTLDEDITSLTLVSAISPIIVNYVCELTQQEDTTTGVITSVDSSRIWGQVAGIFTGVDKVLKYYFYNYGPGELPYRVYSNSEEKYLITYMGRTIVDNTTFGLYKTTNLFDIIEEETRHQVEYIYEVQTGFYQDDNGEWTDGSLYYNFSYLMSFDIEADPGTKLYIGESTDGSDAREVIIGPTGLYSLDSLEGEVKYIALSEGQFAIINYKCLTSQTKMKKGE